MMLLKHVILKTFGDAGTPEKVHLHNSKPPTLKPKICQKTIYYKKNKLKPLIILNEDIPLLPLFSDPNWPKC